MTAMEAQAPAAPRVRGRLRRRPTGPILRARAILSGIIAMVIMVAGALLVASLVFHSSEAGFGALPDKPGLLVQIWPAYVVAIVAWASGRGFRDRRPWALGLAVLVSAILIVGALVLFYTIANPPGGKALDGNGAFGLATLGAIFLAFGIPLLWSLLRGLTWFTDRTALQELKTAKEITAEAARVQAGMRRRMAMLPGLAAMTVSVVVGSSGKRVSCRRRKPRSAQSSSDARNRFTKTPSWSRQ